MRLTHYGVVGIVMVDQEGELESTFVHECEELGIDIRVSGSHGGRQQGLVERHVGLLIEICINNCV